MLIRRCFFTFGHCLALFLFAINAGAVPNLQVSFDSGSQASIKQAVIGQQIQIMPQLNKLNFGLGWSDHNNFFYEKSLSKIFFQDHRIIVKIADIDFNETNITLTLFHPVFGIGIITFVFNEDLIFKTSGGVIQKILLTTLGDVNHQYVFANPDSRKYHLYSCLHSEQNGHLIRMSKKEAENQGYQPGGFCFNKVVYLPDLAIETEIAIQWLTRLHEHALFMVGSQKQETVNRLGHQILDKWPLQLLGYNYSFHVINSQRMTTMAIPTGKIFITTALMEALESEEEIEALLVRAIAHIENRHSLKQYYLKSNAIKNKQFLRRLTSATGTVSGIFAGPGAGAIKALGNMPFHASSNDKPLSVGFGDDFEKVADTVAALYFDRQGKDKRPLSAVIRKLQLAALYFSFQQSERFDLNAVMNNSALNEMPKQLYLGIWGKKKDVRYNERAKRAEHIKFVYFNDVSSFFHQNGRRLPVQLDLKYQSIISNENKVMVYLNDKSLLNNHEDFHNRSLVTLLILDKHGEHRFKLLKRYTTADMWGVRLTFENGRDKPSRFLEGVQNLKLEIVEAQGPVDKGHDPEIKHFTFVKGRLDSENRVADRHQSDS